MENRSTPVQLKNYFNFNNLAPALEWLAEQQPGGFFVYKADSTEELIYANKALLRIFACETLQQFKDLTGYTFPGLVHPDDRQKTLDDITEQIADKNNKNQDRVIYRIVRLDGVIRLVEDFGHLATMPEYGDVYYVFINDITDQRRFEEKTQHYLKIYNGMLEHYKTLSGNSLAIARVNLSSDTIEEVRGSDLYHSDKVGASFKASQLDRVKSFLSVKDQRAFQKVFSSEALIEKFNREIGTTSYVGVCRRPSGNICFVKFTRSVIFDPITNDVICFCNETVYNEEKVTEVLNQKVLAKQYDMVTYLVGNNYGVVIGDAANIKSGNIFPAQKHGVYTDYMENQVLPVADPAIHDKEKLREQLSPQKIKEALEKDECYVIDVTCVINKEVYNKRFTFYLVDPNAQFYILLKSDVTALIKEERRKNQLLEMALKDAEYANAAKTAFLSNMSHEIRTPMNAIIGIGDIALKDDSITPVIRDHLEKINTSARHLLGIINDILDINRIESGKVTLKNEEFKINDLIQQIKTMVSTQCADKGLTFKCTTIGELHECYIGDSTKLKQTFLNILSNAVKFTNAPGTISFSIQQLSEFENNATLEIKITDTGIGMDKKFIPKIFDAFSQEDSSRTNKYGSTGLGMAITASIIKMMNGTIKVESEKGVGTKCTVVVTLRNVSQLSVEENARQYLNKQVLILDNDIDESDYEKKVLGEFGIIAETCDSCSKAFKMLEVKHGKNEPYHLILLDWNIKDQSALDFAKKVNEKYKDEINITLLVDGEWSQIDQQAKNAGITDHLKKPLTTQNIIDIFDHIQNTKKEKIVQEIPKADLNGRHILLAEDIAINAEIMKKILSMRNMKVDHAENGQIALEKFKESSPDYYSAILMDIRMPVMDGLQSTQAIRALDRDDAKRIPIIAMTANAFDEDVQHSLQAGMNAHLTKPVDQKHLYETLEIQIGKNINL